MRGFLDALDCDFSSKEEIKQKKNDDLIIS